MKRVKNNLSVLRLLMSGPQKYVMNLQQKTTNNNKTSQSTIASNIRSLLS